MTQIRWSPRSGADLESIHDRISRDAPPYASLVVQRIVAAVGQLARFPEIGRIVPERGDPELRELIVRPYRVVYRVRPELIEVVTVFHAAQRLPAI